MNRMQRIHGGVRREPLLTLPVILGAIGIACLLGIAALVLLNLPGQKAGTPAAGLTLIAGPTSTLRPLPTATIDPLLAVTPTVPAGSLGLGVYVQVSGTQGEGLRIRSAPGLSAQPVLLGYDAEVFRIDAGPETADGIVWWYLVAPYDVNRAGWAAAQYLTIIPSP